MKVISNKERIHVCILGQNTAHPFEHVQIKHGISKTQLRPHQPKDPTPESHSHGSS